MTMLQFENQCVPSNSSYEHKYLQTIRVTFTLEVGTWVLYTTRHLDVVDVCAKLFQNPSMHEKVIVRTQICIPIICNCDSVNLQNINVTLTFIKGTWFLDATQHCYVIDIGA
jgi:hypothetical protein